MPFTKKTSMHLIIPKGIIIILFSSLLVAGGVSSTWGRATHKRVTTSSYSKKSKGKTVRETANRKSLDWDLSIKEQVYKSQLKELRRRNIPIDNNPSMVARLKRIMNRLKRKSLIPELPYEVHYVDHKTANAVCYPGGGTLFFRGLFDPDEGLVNRRSDGEIAAVMAHEIAHATLRHGYKSYKKRQAVGIFGSIASLAIGAAGSQNWSEVFNMAFDVSTGIYFPHYSRKNESAADLEGIFTMIGTGYNPEKAISVWERAAAKKGKRAKTSIFASHPSSGKRAKNLKRHLESIRTEKAGQ